MSSHTTQCLSEHSVCSLESCSSPKPLSLISWGHIKSAPEMLLLFPSLSINRHQIGYYSVLMRKMSEEQRRRDDIYGESTARNDKRLNTTQPSFPSIKRCVSERFREENAPSSREDHPRVYLQQIWLGQESEVMWSFHSCMLLAAEWISFAEVSEAGVSILGGTGADRIHTEHKYLCDWKQDAVSLKATDIKSC